MTTNELTTRYELEHDEDGTLIAVIDTEPPAELMAKLADEDDMDDGSALDAFIPPMISTNDDSTWFPEGCTSLDGTTSVTWWRHN